MMKYSNDTSDDVDLGWIHELAGRSSRPLRHQETNLKSIQTHSRPLPSSLFQFYESWGSVSLGILRTS